MHQEAIVYVVEDDSAARTAIRSLLDSVGLRVQTFGSAQEFLDYPRPDAPACLVLDVRLPGASGLDFQRELAGRNIVLPIIFITGHGDIPMSVEAMKAGALEFLTKPFRGQVLLDAIHKAIELDGAAREEQSRTGAIRARAATLTSRERQVLELVISGLLNKQIAAELGTSERTVKIHRGQVMRKMGAQSLPDLVRMADRLGIASRNRPGL
jgi:FixJ family two-component response regulator